MSANSSSLADNGLCRRHATQIAESEAWHTPDEAIGLAPGGAVGLAPGDATGVTLGDTTGLVPVADTSTVGTFWGTVAGILGDTLQQNVC